MHISSVSFQEVMYGSRGLLFPEYIIQMLATTAKKTASQSAKPINVYWLRKMTLEMIA